MGSHSKPRNPTEQAEDDILAQIRKGRQVNPDPDYVLSVKNRERIETSVLIAQGLFAQMVAPDLNLPQNCKPHGYNTQHDDDRREDPGACGQLVYDNHEGRDSIILTT